MIEFIAVAYTNVIQLSRYFLQTIPNPDDGSPSGDRAQSWLLSEPRTGLFLFGP